MERRRHVLVVEDDAELRAALEELFEQEGYEVEPAENGAEAIARLEGSDDPPCAVLVDLLMPGIVGQELLEYMRDNEATSAIPVAIVSGSPHLAPAGYPVFPKPLDLGTLVDFVREHSIE
jgi:CheY-like chemotaxis protein